jgi:hypothetical protein
VIRPTLERLRRRWIDAQQRGELSVNFTILSNDGQKSVVKQALDALKDARQDGV